MALFVLPIAGLRVKLFVAHHTVCERRYFRVRGNLCKIIKQQLVLVLQYRLGSFAQ